MTENEKRIITLLYQYGPLSKIQLSKKGRMGWATVVKMINRLIDKEFIVCAGIAKDEKKRGKDANVYNLIKWKPLVIGVDMEYEVTTIMLTNLRGENLSLRKQKSPVNPNLEGLKKFLLESISGFLGKHRRISKAVIGIGIGIPGMDLPAHLSKHGSPESNNDLAAFLSNKLGKRVKIDVNTRVYTLFEKWTNQPFASEDFILVTIRTGIGLGIFLNGKLFVGKQGFAGGIGHYKVFKKGEICKCGDRGCLETFLNQNNLYNEYQTKVTKRKINLESKTPHNVVIEGISNLFTLASQGNKDALSIIRETAVYLSYPLAPVIAVLNVPQIIISGYFGPEGGILIKYLDTEIRKKILSDIDFNLQYYPMDDMGFTRGSALLVLNEYFACVPG